jgi:hypothetical protein
MLQGPVELKLARLPWIKWGAWSAPATIRNSAC